MKVFCIWFVQLLFRGRISPEIGKFLLDSTSDDRLLFAAPNEITHYRHFMCIVLSGHFGFSLFISYCTIF